MAKGIIIPTQFVKENINESPLGILDFYQNLFISDLEIGSNKLGNFLLFDESADQLTNTSVAMKMILKGSLTTGDRDEFIIGQENNYATTTETHYTVLDDDVEDKVFVLTKYVVTCAETQICWAKVNSEYFIDPINLPVGTHEQELFILLKKSDTISITGTDANLKYTFYGRYIPKTLIDVFIKLNNFIGQGIANGFDLNLNSMSSLKTFDDLFNNKSAMIEICNREDVMDFLEIHMDIFDLLKNETPIVKWIAARAELNISEYNNFTDIINNLNAIASYEYLIPTTKSTTLNIIKNAIFSNMTILNQLINSIDINTLALMANGQMLLSTPFVSVGDLNGQLQMSDSYRLYMSGNAGSAITLVDYSNEKIDLTDVDSIDFDFDFTLSSGMVYLYVGVDASSPNSNSYYGYFDAYSTKYCNVTETDQTLTVDVSALSGEYYLCIELKDSSTTVRNYGYVYLKNIILKK